MGGLTTSDAPMTLRPSGDLDLLTVDDLRSDLAFAVMTTETDIVVDLSDVDHVDIVALSAILAAADSLKERSHSLYIAAARPELRRVCALLRADDVLLPDGRDD